MEAMDGTMTDTLSGFGTFFIPGPTEVRQEVLAAMNRPMIPHRSSEFEELFARLRAGLKYVFQTDRPVYVAAASATGVESAIGTTTRTIAVSLRLRRTASATR